MYTHERNREKEHHLTIEQQKRKHAASLIIFECLKTLKQPETRVYHPFPSWKVAVISGANHKLLQNCCWVSATKLFIEFTRSS